MQTSPYWSFSGNCEEALKFYEKSIGAKIEALVTYGETPMADKMPEDWRKKVVHSRARVGDMVLMAADVPPDKFQAPKGVSLMIGVDTPEEAERVFKALSEDGQVQMPMQETFWAKRFGSVKDRFGTPWMVNCEKPRM